MPNDLGRRTAYDTIVVRRIQYSTDKRRCQRFVCKFSFPVADRTVLKHHPN